MSFLNTNTGPELIRREQFLWNIQQLDYLIERFKAGDSLVMVQSLPGKTTMPEDSEWTFRLQGIVGQEPKARTKLTLHISCQARLIGDSANVYEYHIRANFKQGTARPRNKDVTQIHESRELSSKETPGIRFMTILLDLNALKRGFDQLQLEISVNVYRVVPSPYSANLQTLISAEHAENYGRCVRNLNIIGGEDVHIRGFDDVQEYKVHATIIKDTCPRLYDEIKGSLLGTPPYKVTSTRMTKICLAFLVNNLYSGAVDDFQIGQPGATGKPDLADLLSLCEAYNLDALKQRLEQRAVLKLSPENRDHLLGLAKKHALMDLYRKVLNK